MDTQLAIGLAPQKTVLENGLALLTKRTRTTPAVSINVAVRAGSACDPADAVGATWLLSRTIDRGTATRSASAIAEELDSRGITLSVGVSRHLFSLACTCLAEDFEPVFALAYTRQHYLDRNDPTKPTRLTEAPAAANSDSMAAAS